MKIKVERCWDGTNKEYFRLTLPNGDREYIMGYTWNRQKAKEAKDLFERCYGIDRKKIRFV